MIDRPLQQLLPDQPPPQSAEVELPPEPSADGSVEVDLDPDKPEGEPIGDVAHGDNLAVGMDQADLDNTGSEVFRMFTDDDNSRDDWKKMLKEGMDLLGFKYEQRSTPWPGACGASSSLIAEAAVRFQSNCIMETFPSEAGPVKAKIVGDITPDVEAQAERVTDYMNYCATERMADYRPETEKMYFGLAISGAAFRKVYCDPMSGDPEARYVPAEDFVMPYGASSLKKAPRYTEVIKMPKNDLRKLQVAGFYLDIDLGDPVVTRTDEVQEKKDKISREQSVATVQDYYELLEMHADWDMPGFEDPDEIALPYIITIERGTQKVLRIGRNWDERDEKREKKLYYTAYHYIPGFGAYGFGLIHLIGGMAKSSTSLLRQLVDAGTLANLPGGYKSKSARLKDDQSPISPGEFRDVDIMSGKLEDSFYILPFKGPNEVLFELMQYEENGGRRLASTTDIEIGDMSSQAPVGTTLALLENRLKVMTAIQARVQNSLHEEFKILARVIKEGLPEHEAYPYNVQGGSRSIKKTDFDDRVDVFPVSNLNSATMAQRVMQYQAATQLSQMAPQIYDMPELHRETLKNLGIKNADKIIPDRGNVPMMDPVSENMALMTGKPVKAYETQNHEAHIQAHMAFKQDPQTAQIMGQNPQAQTIASGFDAHIQEHLGYAWREKLQAKMGVPLPQPGQPLPADVESQLSMMVAEASQQVLSDSKQKAAQAQAEEQAKDPVLQQNAEELKIKSMQVQQKGQTDQAKLQLEKYRTDKREETERMRIGLQHQQAGAQSQAKSQKDEENLLLELVRLRMELEQSERDNVQHKADIAEAMARLDQMGGLPVA